MNRTNIDWPELTHTWNPITGCRRGCKYCYARRIYQRFNKTSFSEIKFHPDRMHVNLKNPSVVFVGSMSDIAYWPKDKTQEIINLCARNIEHVFMFLSKDSTAYSGFDWPPNTMQGLTLTLSETKTHIERSLINMTAFARPFLSIEPLLWKIEELSVNFALFELVIVGAMTGPGAVPVKQEWIDSIKGSVPKHKLYFKKNLKM